MPFPRNTTIIFSTIAGLIYWFSHMSLLQNPDDLMATLGIALGNAFVFLLIAIWYRYGQQHNWWWDGTRFTGKFIIFFLVVLLLAVFNLWSLRWSDITRGLSEFIVSIAPLLLPAFLIIGIILNVIAGLRRRRT